MVTLWLLSTDNLNRPEKELRPLLGIIERAVDTLAATHRWRIHPVGALDLLPARTAARLKAAEDRTRDVDGMLVNVAVGYGGRREIADAVRSLLQEHASRGTSIEELAEVIDVEHIAEHLYTKGQPDPDLVIRTSGEQRLGGFLLWQSAHSEFYFCEAYWPDFRKVDFLRALRAFGERQPPLRLLSRPPASGRRRAAGCRDAPASFATPVTPVPQVAPRPRKSGRHAEPGLRERVRVES